MSIAAYLAKLSEGVNSSGILSTSKGGTGTTSGGAFPTITSISYGGDGNDTATDIAGGKTVTITGSNFVANAKILINGVAAPVVSVVNENTITFTTPAMAAGTYVLYMVNADGGTAIAVPGISFSGIPIWSTAAGTVATVSETQPISASLGITSNSAITLSLLSGTLPPGAIFNSNGTISGTSQLTASPTTYTFTLRATDAELQDTDRQFSIVINPEVVVWSNPTDGGTVTAYTGISNTINLNAIGSSGNAIASYSANTLPSGLTLAGSTITGSANTVGTSSTTLTATTANTGRTGQITFNWNVLVGGDLYWKNTSLLLSGNSTADASLSDYLILNNQLTTIGDTRVTNFNPYQAGYYSNYFDGTGDWCTVTAGTHFQFTGDYTIEAWIYVTVLTDGLIFGTATGGGQADQFGYSSTGQFYFANALTAAGLITTNNWIHVAASRSGTTQKLFVNGVLQLTSTVTGTIGQNLAGYIGRRPDTYSPVNGYISNLRIIKGTSLYSSTFTLSTTPLTAIDNTVLLTCQSARIVDNSVNAFTIARVGDVSVQQVNPFGVPATATTNNLYSTYFDGTGDRLSIASNALLALGTGDFTIEMWVYNQSTTNRLISWGVTTSPIVFINSSNQLVYENYGTGTLQTSTSTISLNTWTHVALSRNTGVTRMYINGVVANSTPLADTNNWGQSGLYIGVDVSTTYMTGSISNLRVVKGTGLYPSGTTFTPPTSSLTAVTNTLLLTCQDATLRDNSTNQFTITSTGDARPIAQSPFTQTTTTVGLTNVGSTYFDGTGDAAYIAGDGNVVNFGNGNYTIEAWVYHITGVGIMDTCPGGVVTPTNRIQFNVNLDGSVTYITYQGNQTLIATAAGLALPRQWNHVALVKSNNQTRIYVNGVQGGSTYADTLTMPSQVNRPFIMGNGYDGGQGGTAYLSNYRITKGVAVYTTTFTPPTAPLTVVNGTQALFFQTSQAPNNSQFVDNSTAANPITRFGNTTQGTFAPYGSNWSGYFNNSTADNIVATSIASYAIGTGNFTVEAFVNFNAWTGTQRIFTLGVSGTDGLSLVRPNANSLETAVGGVYPITYAWTPNVGQWYHIALVRSGTGTGQLALYIDGLVVATATSTGSIGQNQINIGGISWQAQNMQGFISNFRFSNIARTIAVPTAPYQPDANTLLLTCQDNRFVDNSPLNNTITRNGSAATQRFSPFGSTIQTPVSYSTYLTSATDSRFTVPANTAFAYGTGDFTVECWFLVPTMTAANSPIIFAQTVSGTNYFWNGLQASGGVLTGKAVFIGTASGGGTDQLSGSNLFTAGTWNHFAVCRVSGIVTVYLNGQGGTPTANATDFNNTTYVPTIGGYTHAAANPFNGNISSLRVIKGTALYTANFTPPTAPLTAVAGTSLLTCQNTTLRDNSTNAFTVTSTGSATPKTINPFGFTNSQGSAYTPALYGASAYFDGTGDYLTNTALVPSVILGTSNFCIEAWGYWTSFNAGTYGSPIFTLNGPTSVIELRASKTAATSTSLNLYAYYAGGTFIGGNSAGSSYGTIYLNQWTHVAVARQGSAWRVFINGVVVGTITDAASFTGALTSTTVGADPSPANGLFTGWISDCKVTVGNAVYTGNFVPPQAPLTATAGTTLLLNMDKGAIVDYTKSANLETTADAKINNESAYNGGYYSNYFDGSGDTFSTPAGINTAMGVGFAGNILSFESWVFPQNHNFGAYAQMIAGAYAAVSANGRWYLGFDKTANSTTQLVFGWTTSSGSQTGVTTTTFPITHGQWNHIAVTVDATTAASSTVKLFANGVLLNTFTAQDFSSQTAYWQPTQIGGCGSTTYTSEFHGYISNFRILKGSFAYTGNYTVPTAPLTAITNTVLLTCQSNTFKDNSTNAFALTRNGDVKVRSLNPFQRNTNTSMYFDGTGDALPIPYNPVLNLGAGNFTIEFWSYVNATPSTEGYFFSIGPAGSGAVNRGLRLAVHNGTTAGIYFCALGIGSETLLGSFPTAGVWNHIAFVRNGTTVTGYVNGIALGTTFNASTSTITDISVGDYSFVGGLNSSGGTPRLFYNGYLEDLRVTRGVARYTANFAPPTAKLTNK